MEGKTGLKGHLGVTIWRAKPTLLQRIQDWLTVHLQPSSDITAQASYGDTEHAEPPSQN